MSETKTEGLIYKGHPLRRIDNLIYYGTMADPYIVMMQILESKKENGLDMATKVSLQLQTTNPNVKARDRVVKKGEREQPVARRWISLPSGWSGRWQVNNPLLPTDTQRERKRFNEASDEKGRKGRCFTALTTLALTAFASAEGDGHWRRLHHRYFPAPAFRAKHLLRHRHHAEQVRGRGPAG